LVKRLRCSVLVAQTEISDDEFDKLKQPGEMPTADPASQHAIGLTIYGIKYRQLAEQTDDPVI
jgi:hypothetical protein